VFLMNVFKHSPVEQEWRVVAGAALERWDGETLGSTAAGSSASSFCLDAAECAAAACRRTELFPLPLDAAAHAALAEELKMLYVALTRARRRVVVFDQDVKKRKPMFAFLASPVLRRAEGASDATVAPPVAVLGDRPAARRAELGGGALAQASSAAEWRAKGEVHAARGECAFAAQCFAHAGDEAREQGARGELDCERAAAAAEQQQPERARALFASAARRFLRAGCAARAGDCLRAAGEAALADALAQKARQ
jgi:hypothetical protein